ncbi:glycosyltransferase [Actibacterium sp. MT2.3-13A]|uniref:glycosyltransferase n=1 Tax=Actibacterium sp. MT2.3-13A TaxID=2828332 RepID=UPI001BA79DEF|nr:glycosyltransferase [Actibacterium sp. MT2.3-13A]
MTGTRPSRVVVITDFASVRGGASKLAMLQTGLLSARGVPVTVFAGDAGGAMPEGVQLVALGGARLLEQGRLAAALGGLWNRAAHAALRDWIATQDDPRIIYHVHGIQQTLSPSVLRALQPVRARVVLHAHDYFLSCPNGAFFDFRAGESCARTGLSAACIARNCDKRSYAQKLWRVTRQGLQDRETRRLFGTAVTVLIHAGMRARLAAGRPQLRTEVLPNPAEPLLPAPADPAANAEFLYVGDVHAYKGVFLLAEAARRAGVKLRILGDGLDRARLAAAYPEHCLDGWADRDKLAESMRQARALVAPTLGPEPYGLAPVEALLAGVPVVISDSMLLSSDIDRFGAGVSFAAGNAASLSQALRRIADDDGAVRRMSARTAAAAAEITTTPEAWCDGLLDIYSGLLDAASRSPAG